MYLLHGAWLPRDWIGTRGTADHTRGSRRCAFDATNRILAALVRARSVSGIHELPTTFERRVAGVVHEVGRQRIRASGIEAADDLDRRAPQPHELHHTEEGEQGHP